MKRVLCFFLSLIFVLAFHGIAEDEQSATYVMAGLDLNESRKWNDNDFFKRMEEKTGVVFDFRQYSDPEQWRTAKERIAKNEEQADVLFKANLSQSEVVEMGGKGILIDLLPYLPECCPNLWDVLQENPEYLQAITLPDGKVYALPQLQDYSTQNFLWINEAWIKTLGLVMPTTAQELVEVLTAFQENDPNRNGRKDEIPLGFIGVYDLKFLAHAFGLIANDYNIYQEDGQVLFMPLQPEYRTFITWLKDLYDAGLIDHEGFTMVDTMRTITDENKPAVYGMIFANTVANTFQVPWMTDYIQLLPLQYEGKQIYRDLAGDVKRGTFAITSTCKNPEEILRWVDTLYTDEGAILASIGEENVDFVIDGDETWRYLDHVQGNQQYFVNYALIEDLPAYPGIQVSDFRMNMSGITDAQRAPLKRQNEIKPLMQLPMPYTNLTDAQQGRINDLHSQIGYSVDLQMGRWILGEEEISDATFEAFEKKLYELGLEEFLSLWQSALEQN